MKLSVLILDDDGLSQIVLSRQFEALGHRAVIAPDIQAARARLDQARFHALVVDIHLGLESGLDFMAWVRGNRGWFTRLPVIAVTAMPDPALRERAMTAGANFFLNKPYTLDILDTTLRVLGLVSAIPLPDPEPYGLD